MNSLRISFYTVIVFLIFGTTGFSQELILFEKIRTFKKNELSSVFFIEALYDVDVYRVHYTTKDVYMEKDTASGILCIPVKENTIFPMLIYDHGTVSSRQDVPSFGSFEQNVSAVFASFGYHTVAPDYIGLGISKGLHPYVHPESEARSGIDLVLAVQGINDLPALQFNEQLFITGYSQGGHAAMATARMLAETGELEVTAAGPMSGPYSVSKEMKSFTFGDQEYNFCAYVGSVLLTVKYAYPELFTGLEIENFLKPEYAAFVRQFEREEIDLDKLNEKMVAKLKQNGGKVLPKRMFIDSVAVAFLTNDDHPINQALRRLDVCDWKPEMPLKMFYCLNDDQVTYRNSVYSDSLMKANGSEMVSSVDVFSFGNHGTCFYPAAVGLRNFFAEYQQIGTVGTIEIDNTSLAFWPNPANDVVYFDVKSNEFIHGETEMRLFDLSGQMLIDQKWLKDGKHLNKMDISNLNPGLYLINFSGQNGLNKTFKLVKTGY
jgi:pimeloyl-ACP methyl ester carboxylesterase